MSIEINPDESQDGGGGGGRQSDEAEGGADATVLEDRPDLTEPPQYAVILHNDDYTTVEFVVEVLKRFFHKSDAEAEKVTISVHKNGKGVAGVYNFEIAETKTVQVKEAARERGFPLKCTAEKMT